VITPRYHVTHLRDGGAPAAGAVPGASGAAAVAAVAPDTLQDVFRAPWEGVALVALEPGSRIGPRTLERSEAMVYVTAGRGQAHLHSGPVDLREGIALTLFRDELLDLQAAPDEPLELFMAEVGIGAGR
jgi:quercetin dioxygenase-like cupin family protein